MGNTLAFLRNDKRALTYAPTDDEYYRSDAPPNSTPFLGISTDLWVTRIPGNWENLPLALIMTTIGVLYIATFRRHFVTAYRGIRWLMHNRPQVYLSLVVVWK
uniref:Uncharacterized protein n=1 Tax=Clandestinovirus TaxID=2831644 RepID=A0A8F8PNH2_9VIRU|nr:hypothetical protein KOM_12_549 [Clandestinovirus]